MNCSVFFRPFSSDGTIRLIQTKPLVEASIVSIGTSRNTIVRRGCSMLAATRSAANAGVEQPRTVKQSPYCSSRSSYVVQQQNANLLSPPAPN